MILLHGATPAAEPAARGPLAGKPVEITAQPYAMWEGRGCRNGFTWLTPGLSQVDLYWKVTTARRAGRRSPSGQAEDRCRWSVRPMGPWSTSFPARWSKFPSAGANWSWTESAGRRRTRRSKAFPCRASVSAMMTALGVRIAPYAPPRSLPAMSSKPIDLSAFCNRGFKDDVGGDEGRLARSGTPCGPARVPTGEQNFAACP